MVAIYSHLSANKGIRKALLRKWHTHVKKFSELNSKKFSSKEKK